VFTHETNRDRKPLLKAVETGLFGLTNWKVQFYQDRRQSWAPPGFDKTLLLRPSDVWTVERHEPQQLWRFKWWLRVLIDENKRKLENCSKKYETMNSINCVEYSLQSIVTYVYIDGMM
jgi:hypothetical protein